jgi:hypothetical protein
VAKVLPTIDVEIGASKDAPYEELLKGEFNLASCQVVAFSVKE